MNPESKYYVYALLDTRKCGPYYYKEIDKVIYCEPIYIGKGKGERYKRHFILSSLKEPSYKNNLIKKIFNETGKYPEVVILENDLSEEMAFAWEMNYIKTIGRKSIGLGPLTNMTDGGENPPALKGSDHPMFGKPCLEQTKKAVSLAHKGKPGFNLNKKLSEETKDKIRQSHIGLYSGDNHPMYGKTHSEKSKEQMKNSHIGLHVGEKSPVAKIWFAHNVDGTDVGPIFNFQKFCSKYNLQHGNMSKIALGKRKFHKGWTCKNYTKSEYKQLLQSIESITIESITIMGGIN